MLGTAGAVLMLFAPAAFSAGLPVSERHVMSVGHTDVVNVSSTAEGTFEIDIKDDSGPSVVYRDPGDVLLHARPESQTAAPGVPPYDFLGPVGTPVWVLPQVQDPSLLWPGWESVAVSAQLFPETTLTWRMIEFSGPGEASLFTTDSFGNPTVMFDSADPMPQTAQILNRSHTHANWAFEAQGLYRMVIEIEGLRNDGATVTSDRVEYRWFVGDLADLPPDEPPTTLAVDGAAGRYVVGDAVSLTARQDPQTGLTDVRWTVRCPTDAAARPAGAGVTLAFTAALEHNGCAYRATLHDAQGDAVAESAPVTLAVESPAPPGDDTPPAPEPQPRPQPQPPAPAEPAPAAPRVTSTPRAAAPVLRLAGTAKRTPAVRRAGAFSVGCTLTARGRCAVRATITSAAARRLGVPVRRGVSTVTIATGSRTFEAAGRGQVRVTLTAQGRRVLARAGRTPVRVTFTGTTAGKTRRAALVLRG